METTNELFMLYVIGIGLVLLLVLASVLIFYASHHKKRKHQFNVEQAKLKSEVKAREKLLFKSFQSQEAERERVAKDIHDEVGAKLNMINLYLNRLKPKTPDTDTSISEMREVLNNTINTSSRISHELLPPTLENFGLHAAIEEFGEATQQIHKVSVSVKMYGERPLKDCRKIELNLFRILQELISCSLTYARTSAISIILRQSEEKFVVDYRDDACGGEESEDAKQQELSIKIIESRLQMIKGTFDLKKEEDEHTHIKMEVKLDSEAK